ncbi:MAG: hypothetical protein IJ147_03460 [Lachnospiraceae bacterium]|nr:hypothetical protein [Lachnospiraceae bacterium]
MKKGIGGKLIILAMVILISTFIFCLFYESIFYKTRDIKINYVCELPISSNMDNIVLLKDPFPRLRCISVLEFEKILGEILDGADLSESELAKIKALIENIPDDKYIYISIRYKLEGVYYSDKAGSYGHNGIYSSQEYEAIFIYWADEPLGNMIDGYI